MFSTKWHTGREVIVHSDGCRFEPTVGSDWRNGHLDQSMCTEKISRVSICIRKMMSSKSMKYFALL